MERTMILLSFILLMLGKLLIFFGILLFLIVFSPILLLGDENRFLSTIQRLHEYVTN